MNSNKIYNNVQGATELHSALSNPLQNLTKDFIEKFRGFVDAEGCFLIARTGDTFAFRFLIKLHIDDKPVLDTIQKTLGLGRVTTYKSSATYAITSQKEIKSILDIFTKYNLNTTKHLNFLSFKKAFEIYTGSKIKNSNLIQEIASIKSSMNTKRTVFDTTSFKTNITPEWLLGFVEGDGSFSVSTAGLILRFSIAQKGNLGLMEAIKKFFVDLAKTKGLKDEASYIYITGPDLYIQEGILNQDPQAEINYVLTIKNVNFIQKVLIPFFDSMSWLSKKELDYNDWKTILKIKELGLHFTDNGKDLIDFLLGQMNNNRLSTCKSPDVKKTFTSVEIESILNKSSNYELQEDGRILIKSSNKYSFSRKSLKVILIDSQGSIFKVFNSKSSCAEFLGISSHTVTKTIEKNRPVYFNGEVYNITGKIEE
jgi:hypothetical protein